MQDVLELLHTGPYLRRRLRDHPSEMFTSKIFNAISSYLCSCSCQHYYHIKQKRCIFFLLKSFCDTQKVQKRRLRPRICPEPSWGSSRRSRRPLVGWEGDTPPQSSPFSTPSVSRTPSEIFFLHTALVAQLYFLALDSRHLPGGRPPEFFSARTAPAMT